MGQTRLPTEKTRKVTAQPAPAENASEQIVQWIAQLLGAGDPAAQVMGIAGALEAPVARMAKGAKPATAKAIQSAKEAMASGSVGNATGGRIAPLAVPGAASVSDELGRLMTLTGAMYEHTPVAVPGYRFPNEVVDRIGKLFEAGAGEKGAWDASALLPMFSGDRNALLEWARLFGATSPQTSVPQNLAESLAALLSRMRGHNTFTPDQAIAAGMKPAGAKVRNLNLALSGQPLGTPKTEALSQGMSGANMQRIPQDLHHLAGVGSRWDNFDANLPSLRARVAIDEGLSAVPTPELYYRAESAAGDAMKQVAPSRDIFDTFAQFWSGVKQQKGQGESGDLLGLMRALGLGDPGAMTSEDAVTRALAEIQGYPVVQPVTTPSGGSRNIVRPVFAQALPAIKK
jgi:hypothetical protein